MDVRKVLLVALMFFAGQASATLIEFHADQYADNTNVSHVSAGLTLQNLSQSSRFAELTRSAIYSQDCGGFTFYCGSHTGTSTLSPNPTQITGGFASLVAYRDCIRQLFTCTGFNNVLEITFAEATDYLSLETTFASDPGGIIAYDVNGNELFSCYYCGTAVNNPDIGGVWFVNLSVQRQIADIARVVYAGVDGVGRISGITYSNNSVPEPGTIALLATTGLLGLAIGRRRKARAVTAA